MSKYSIEESTLTGIADAVRDLRYENDPLTPAEIEAKIRASEIGILADIQIGDVGPWVRPDDWPNLDEIEMDDNFDGVYLTYDLRKTPGYGWIGVYVSCNRSGQYLVERGHLENNSFVVEETYSISTANSFRKPLDESNGNVQLWRVLVAPEENIHIQKFYFKSSEDTTAMSTAQKLQPCVEATGNLPYITTIASDNMSTSSSAVSYSTIWMERDSRVCGEKSVVTTLAQAWEDCYNLRSLDVSKWNTSNWKVWTLSETFRYCFNLCELDLNSWDTSNWEITTMAGMFYYCLSLKTLNIDDWNTTNWRISSLKETFYMCASIKELSLNKWDTSNWPVTNFTNTFSRNFSLERLDLNDWDTSNWAVTTLAGLFSSCFNLKKLHIGAWNTSNWAVTSLAELFRYCRNLQDIDINDWDTSNWAVTSLAYMFAECWSITNVNLNNWDTSKWNISSLRLMFEKCYKLKTINIGEWDTSNWVTTTAESLCVYCYSLEQFDFNNWDTSNWEMTTIASMFQDCRSLKQIDLTHWNTSKWAITGIRYLFSGCYSLERVDVTGWDTTKFEIVPSGLGYAFDTCKRLTTIRGFETWDLSTLTSASLPANEILTNCTGFKVSINHSYTYCYSLTRKSLIDILTVLPVVSGKTITLGSVNKQKLTPEEIAIATDKGWMVA